MIHNGRDSHRDAAPESISEDQLQVVAESLEVNRLEPEDHDEGSGTKQPDPLYRWVILGMSTGVMLLSTLMSIRDEKQVVVPLLGKPLPELCQLRRYTGLDCPGCGLTRSFISIGHAEFGQAWRYNPAAFVLFPVIALQIPFQLLQLERIRRGLPELSVQRLSQVVLGIVTVTLLSQWILRQIGF